MSFLTIIYCFAISFGSYAYALSGDITNSDATQETYAPNVKGKLFCQQSKTESFVEILVENGNCSLHKLFKTKGPSLVQRERSFDAQFLQFRFFSRNLLTNYRKSDHIFPFHYYW